MVKVAGLGSVVEKYGDDNENKCETEVDVELQMKDDDGQRCCNEHGA